MKQVRKLRSVLLSLALVFGLLPWSAAPARAALPELVASVPYRYYTADEAGAATAHEGACGEFTLVGADTAEWTEGWYAVDGAGVEIPGPVSASGTVNLILCDGASLRIAGGISGACTLNVYGQALGTGRLTVTGGETGIRADAVNVHGGTVEAAVTGEDGNGIYCEVGNSSEGGSVCVYGGALTAAGGDDDGYGMNVYGDVFVYGGALAATGGDRGVDTFDVTVTGGALTAAGGLYGLNCYELSVSGGALTATAACDRPSASGSYCGIRCDRAGITGGSVAAEVAGASYDEEDWFFGLYADDGLIVVGGAVTASANGDNSKGIFGATAVAGGTVEAFGYWGGIDVGDGALALGSGVGAYGGESRTAELRELDPEDPEDRAPYVLIQLKELFGVDSLADGRVFAPANAVLLLAEYGADGRLTAVARAVLEQAVRNGGAAELLGLAALPEARFKLMLLSEGSFAPLCEAYGS